MPVLVVLAILTLAGAGCSCASDTPGPADTGPLDASVHPDAFHPDVFVPPDAGHDAGHDAGSDAFVPDALLPVDAGPPRFDAAAARDVTCATPAPAGARHADPPPAYSGGTCPTLAAGHNAFPTTSGTRDFLLILPTGFDPATEHLPVTFLWHWLGGSADRFRDTAMVQEAADRLRFIAVIPEARGDLNFKWPYLTADPGCVLDTSCNCDCHFREELTFFDDMLACVAEQYAPNLDCVSSTGVSAGALWTSVLAPMRSTHLSSMLVLSGGSGDGSTGINPASTLRPWPGETHAMPAFVLWGGPLDFCFLFFEQTSHNLEMDLVGEGAFVEECVHDCMHSVPPFDPAPSGGQFDALWNFAISHPYWLEPGESPYLVRGLPAGSPDWCAIGVGNATPRTGSCPGTTFFLGSCR